MSAPHRPDLSTTLARLRERFLASSDATVGIFAGLAGRLEHGPADPDALDVLHRELHRTHGTSGSYGFHAASRSAAALEAVVARWVADPTLDLRRRAVIVRHFADGLRRAFAGGTAGRRLLLIDVPDEQVVPLASEAFHRGFAAERLAPSALASLLHDDPNAFAGIIAGVDVPLPAVGDVRVVRLSAGDEPTAAITSCCGPPP